MKKINTKHFLIIILIIFLIITAVFLYLKFYGKNIFEAKLSEILGRPVRFESFTLKLDKYTVQFEDFSVPNRRGFKEKNLFNAAKVTVTLDKDKFTEDREIIFKHVFIEKGTLHIERNRKGVFNIAQSSHDHPSYKGNLAYAETLPPSPLYRFAKNVGKVTIEDLAVEFKDYYVFDVPYTVNLDDFNLDITSAGKPDPSKGSIPVRCTFSFLVPSDRYSQYGQVSARLNIDAYTFLTDVDMALETRNMDIVQFKPYFESYTPFIFIEGLFSSKSKLSIETNMINSLTTIDFHRLRLMVNPNKQNAEFLNTSASKLLPYLTSGSGDVIFDFVITGPINNPRIGMGPQLQAAVGMAVVDELSGFLQGLQGTK